MSNATLRLLPMSKKGFDGDELQCNLKIASQLINSDNILGIDIIEVWDYKGIVATFKKGD